jgi:hypothetical protein
MELVELVARIGDTVLEVAYLPASTSQPIGTVQVGLVTITTRRTTLDVPRVPRPRRELRPCIYLAASLIVQLAIWFVAVSLAPLQKVVRPVHRIAHIAHIADVHEPPPPPPPPAPPPAKPAKPAATGAMHAVRPAHLAKTIGEIHIAEKLAASEGPVDPNAAVDEQGFGGGGHRFNVDDVAPEKTYAVTKWALPTYFHVKGELAPIPSITLCDDDSCSVEGPRDMHAILAQLIAHEAEIAMCYREHTGDLEGQIRIRFEISPQGKVTGEYGKPDGPVGYGTGTVGRCVAKIAARLRWGQAPDQARVFIGMAFRPV